MRLQIIGCDGGIGKGLRTTAFLVDNDVLIDSGSGVGDLAGSALSQIEHVFLTHAHLDHIAFLPLLIDATWAKRTRPLNVYALEETLRALKDHVFNRRIWPDFTEIPSSDKPSLRYVRIELGRPTKLGDRQFVAVPAKHTIPTVGYWLDSGRASLVFSGDTTCCDDLWRVVNRVENLKYIFIETAFSDESISVAEQCGHLCPKLLAGELEKLKHEAEIFITHMKPGTHDSIMQEISDLEWATPPKRLALGQEFLI